MPSALPSCEDDVQAKTYPPFVSAETKGLVFWRLLFVLTTTAELTSVGVVVEGAEATDEEVEVPAVGSIASVVVVVVATVVPGGVVVTVVARVKQPPGRLELPRAEIGLWDHRRERFLCTPSNGLGAFAHNAVCFCGMFIDCA